MSSGVEKEEYIYFNCASSYTIFFKMFLMIIVVTLKNVQHYQLRMNWLKLQLVMQKITRAERGHTLYVHTLAAV